jgi:hypothetical protein
MQNSLSLAVEAKTGSENPSITAGYIITIG